MRKCYERYLARGFLDGRDEVFVLDVGGADINGSYRSIFNEPIFRFVAADMEAGQGVDLVLEDPYQIPLEDNSVDVVISGQMLEHCEFFWQAFSEMMRVVKPDGFLFLIAPSAGPIHRYPVDCYRFYPDAYHALAKYTNTHLVEVWHDERGPWYDLVGVFSKQPVDVPARSSATLRLKKPHPDLVATAPCPPGPPEAEVMRGSINYREVLQMAHDILRPEGYLEIGVRFGASLSMASCEAIGVDPHPDVTYPLGAHTTVVEQYSDDFFEETAANAITKPPDLVFIDGMHLFEYALRDFMHIERLASPTTLVLLDDIFPNHPRQAERERSTQIWTGDVWKLYSCLATYRSDLLLFSIDAHPAGLLLVAGLDPSNRVLWDRYNPLVCHYNHPRYSEPPSSILKRSKALSSSSTIREILTVLRDLRVQGATVPQVVAALRLFCVTV